jgi:bifunctional non-homologous end joining protein LigD
VTGFDATCKLCLVTCNLRHVTEAKPLWYLSHMSYFVVHEHHSKRLHYDFRLEMDGVLKSWAIPKGPSMSPADKRLAVMVDDHPLEYGSFEGVIPEGYYGAGPVVIWDSGDFDLLGVDNEKGRIDFVLHGRKLKGTFLLTRFRGKGKDWLLIKKSDAYALNEYEIKPELNAHLRLRLEEKIPPCDTD